MLEAYLEILELGYLEVTEAFKGLADEHVWVRPADGLLSVGELSGHIAYWEAVKFAAEVGDSSQTSPNSPASSPLTEHAFAGKCLISSPLIDHRFTYYRGTVASSPSKQHLAMTAKEVCDELFRVHTESVAHLKALNADLDRTLPGWPEGHTVRDFLKYATFHVAYHTGQMYSARHLLGEDTPDN